MIIYQDLTEEFLESATTLCYSIFKPNTKADTKEILKAFYTSKSTGFIALEDNKVIGVVIISTSKPLFSTQKHAHISWVCVESNYRGRGIAKVLMQMAESWAKTNGCASVDLSSSFRKERESAHRLYETMGYNGDSQRYFIKHFS